MIVERVLGNIYDTGESPHRMLDPFYLDWQDCHRRAVRGRSESGRDIGVLLSVGQSLRHGDILFEDERTRIVCMVRPAQVLVIEPPGAQAMGLLAAELGNLHAPVEIRQNQIITIEDGPVLEILRRCGAPYRQESRIFQPQRSLALPSLMDATSGRRV